MIGIVVVAHGGLAEVMVEVVQGILGPRDALEAVTTEPLASPDDLRAAVRAAVQRVDRGESVVILTDMLGDTQTNVSVEVAREVGAEVVAGINMPILIKLASEETTIDQRSLAAFLCRYGQEHIFWATEQVPAPGRVRRRA
jgi:PTS system mannose-specific IIA component